MSVENFTVPVGKIENRKKVEMEFLEKEKKFVSEKVYKVQPNPTKKIIYG